MGLRSRLLGGVKHSTSHLSGGLAKTKAGKSVIEASRKNQGALTKIGAMGSAVGMAAAVPFGVGAAIATSNPLQSAVDLTMDGLLYDPYLEEQYGIKGSDVDNTIIGRDIGFGELLYNPLTTAKNWSSALSTENIKNTQTHYRNIGKVEKMSMDAYERNMKNVSTIGRAKDEDWAEVYNLPHTPAVRRGQTYASGNMVMGMYNGRHGY